MACLLGTRETHRCFYRYIFSILDISSLLVSIYEQQGELHFVYHKTITDVNTTISHFVFKTSLAFLSDDVIALCWQAGIPLDSDFA